MEHKLGDRIISIILNELYINISPFPTVFIKFIPILKAQNIDISESELQTVLYTAQAIGLMSVKKNLDEGGLVVNITDHGISVINQYGSFLSYIEYIIAEKKLNDDRDAQLLRQSEQIEKSGKDMVNLTRVAAVGTVSLAVIEIVRLIVEHPQGFLNLFCGCH